MKIKKWQVTERCFDKDRGDSEFGYWAEIELSSDEVKEAVINFLWNEYFGDKKMSDIRHKIERLYYFLAERCDVETAFNNEIAEYYGGRAC